MTRPVCLIQPPVRLRSITPCLDDQQYGLGLLALAAWLERARIPVVGIHFPLALAQGSSLGELVQRVRRADPLVIAIGMNWVHFGRGALELAGELRKAAPSVPIVLGGQHASLFAREIAEGHPGEIDAVIVGEAERPLQAICEALAGGGSIPSGLPGVMVAGAGFVPPEVEPDVDNLPLYSYRSLWPPPRQREVAAVSTARGACPFHCAYCIEPVVGRVQGRRRLALHSPDRIADQVEHLQREGVTRFTVQDGFFVGGDRALVATAGALARRGVRPRHLNLFAHPDSFTREGLRAMARAADRVTIDYGVETGAPGVARLARRAMDPARVVESIRDAAAEGIVPYTWWLVGLPGEDEAARSATRELLVETMQAGGVPRWVTPVILFPQAPMHLHASEYGITPRFKDFRDYCAFSDKTMAEALLFPDLITHATADASAEDILAESRALRRFIVDRFDAVERFYRQRGPTPPLDLAEARNVVAGSFF